MPFIIKNGQGKFLAQFGGAWDWLTKRLAYEFGDKEEAEIRANILRASEKKPEEISVQEI